ncbi:MAG: hypothetical protein QOE45_994 [Frankiaceae bacterium]|nr:hypothetical protein [Frankiaceae bacterium]
MPAAVLLLAGCTGVPAPGGVNVVRHVTAEGPELPEPRVFRLPAPAPKEDAPPDEILRGFLVAQVDPRNDHAVARRYLAPDVTWNDHAGVTVAATRVGTPSIAGDVASVRTAIDRVGTISPRGEFRPAPLPARQTVTFRLRRVPGLGWRLSGAPAGLVLGRDELRGTFERTTLYFPNQARRLVPDTVFLPATDQPVGTAVRALLGGPRGWVAPAVRSAIPANTELLDEPSVVDHVATVNLSREIRLAPQETLGALVAQVVWTLTEPVFAVDAVHVQVEGEQLVVPGRPGLRDHRRIDWSEYAPVPETADTRLFFVRDGGAYARDDAGRETRIPVAQSFASIAVNRAGTRLAGVTLPVGGRQSLVFVDLASGRARTTLTSNRITAPAWEPAGDVVWVAHSSGGIQQVVAVSADSARDAVSAVAATLPGPVSSLRLSPDGSRVALVAGAGAASALWLARVERPAAGGRVLADPRAVAPSVRGVTAAAFEGAAQVLFAAYDGRRPAVYRADLDGYDLVRQRDESLPAAAVSTVSASAATPADRAASVGTGIWLRSPGGDWRALPGRGAGGVFAG